MEGNGGNTETRCLMDILGSQSCKNHHFIKTFEDVLHPYLSAFLINPLHWWSVFHINVYNTKCFTVIFMLSDSNITHRRRQSSTKLSRINFSFSWFMKNRKHLSVRPDASHLLTCVHPGRYGGSTPEDDESFLISDGADLCEELFFTLMKTVFLVF